jgi:hypothetical protein
MAWTDELKQEVIEAYQNANPTAENSLEIIQELAQNYEQSPNGVRMILVQAGVYVKKDAAAATGTKTTSKSGGGSEGTKRVSKESSIAALKAAIKARGKAVDDDILDKLTGKAAIYLLDVLTD